MSSGIYIHIPFCQSRCSYCHFVTRPWQAETAERYRKAVVTEIRRFGETSGFQDIVDTVYFGGGTPTLLPAAHIEELLSTIRLTFRVTPDAEVTIEGNPGTISPEKARKYREIGVNRVSMGAQSYDNDELRALERTHTSREIEESVRVLRNSDILNVNLDVMLGLPDQTAASWQRTLEGLAQTLPAHISVYMLDLDVASPLQHAIERGTIRPPDDDLVADLYNSTIEFLQSGGYGQYEISNFSLPSMHSRHNLKYWMREPVLGFGVSSHSFDGHCRYANLDDTARYLRVIEAGSDAVDWRKEVDASAALSESLFLGLRLNRGVDCDALRRSFGAVSFAAVEAALERAIGTGCATLDGGILRLTAKGRLLSNEVFSELV